MAKEYVIDNPNLTKEWHFEKNDEMGLDPKKLTYGSAKRAWWKCAKGHEWQAPIAGRNRGRGCPYCSGRYPVKGKNDLQTVNPSLAKEWNYSKNNGLNPIDVLPNSGKKIWWICKKGHEWQAQIIQRNKGIGCPYCSGRYAIKGENDLQTVNPNLAKEWNYSKNNGLTPMDVLPNSEKKVWWKCGKNHVWQATVASRNRGNGCPICSSGQRTSFPEYALLFYLKKYGLDAIHSYKTKEYELDIYIPSKKVAIEYDGDYWHNKKIEKDLDKNFKCKRDGIKLYRIRAGLPSLNDTSIDYIVSKNRKDLSEVLKKLLCEIIKISVDVDLKRDILDIENLRVYIEKESSLLLLNPQVAQEWNYDKNGKLRPEYFAINSTKKVWWKCDKGHDWQASIVNRNKGTGCPYCSGQKVLCGYNDLVTLYPLLSQEWNYPLNKNLRPENFSAKSGKKVWWICSEGHTYQAQIVNRANGRGCPYCSSSRVLYGETDLATRNPSLAKEWNNERNNGLQATDILPNSNKKVWWKCSKGHEWQATITHRNRGSGCPYCFGRYAIKGETDLATVNPSLAKEWDFEKNNGLIPTDVTPNSGKKVWWQCNKGHKWQATIGHRNHGSGCPYCSGLYVIIGETDLQTVNPSLAREWDYEDNKLTPADVSSNSDKKVWWKCSKGHKWQAAIGHRNKGSGCPYCAREKRKKK